jgi:hypothetical protein
MDRSSAPPSTAAVVEIELSKQNSTFGVTGYHKTPLFFECFLYVCPEPVLVKRCILYLNGTKSGVFPMFLTSAGEKKK